MLKLFLTGLQPVKFAKELEENNAEIPNGKLKTVFQTRCYSGSRSGNCGETET